MQKSVVIDYLPECVQRYRPECAIVAVDVIRATTTAITAAATGRRCFPVPTIGAALDLAQELDHPLLAGESGAGKTCLAFACARKGWTFLSGDATAIVRGRTDHRVLGRPFEIRFRETARQLFPELEGFPRVIRPNGKDDIEIDPRDLRLKCALESTARQVVFLERSPHPISAVAEEFPRIQALHHLEQAVCFGDESSRSEQLRSLETLLTLPTHRLRYYDLDSAERVLRSLVGGGR